MLWLCFSILFLVFHVLPQCILTSDLVTSIESYYACYFNKYFKLALTDTRYQADRSLFVKAKIAAHVEYEERAPSPACVGWMCDQKMVWDWSRKDKLETWTYWAQPGNIISTWEECFLDEEISFRSKNYTFSLAGADKFFF